MLQRPKSRQPTLINETTPAAAHLPACLIIQQGARSVASPLAALTINGASATAGAAAACARTTTARLLLAAGPAAALLRSCCICCCIVAADIVLKISCWLLLLEGSAQTARRVIGLVGELVGCRQQHGLQKTGGSCMQSCLS
jgi:hypothetical protein